MDRLNAMNIFVKVADSGSFTAAARLCTMTPQNIAKAISALEKEIGARLINRSTRRQSLTEIGQIYLERCRSILCEVEESDAIVSNYSGAVKGTLRVAVANCVVSTILSRRLPVWLRANPEIKLQLFVTNRVVNLVEEGFDTVIADEPPKSSELICHPISPMPVILVASPEYLKDHPAPETPEDLHRHRLLTRKDIMTWRFFDGEGRETQIRIPDQYLCNTGQMNFEMALGGLGIAKQPHFRVRPSLERGELVQLLPDWRTPARRVCALYARRKLMTLKLKKFIEFLDRELGQGQLL